MVDLIANQNLKIEEEQGKKLKGTWIWSENNLKETRKLLECMDWKRIEIYLDLKKTSKGPRKVK